jgi:hypothetical protein
MRHPNVDRRAPAAPERGLHTLLGHDHSAAWPNSALEVNVRILYDAVEQRGAAARFKTQKRGVVLFAFRFVLLTLRVRNCSRGA